MNPFSLLLWPALWLNGKITKKMNVCRPQKIELTGKEWYFNHQQTPSIIDLGGGGEGVIGQLLGKIVTAIDLREDELNEAAEGPIKVVADARSLPFEPETFHCATAFYFLMYLKQEDIGVVLQEAFRVLKPGGHLVIWDTIIPYKDVDPKVLYVVPVTAKLPHKSISTAYGVSWNGRKLDTTQLKYLAELAGFTTKEVIENKGAMQLILSKP